MAYTVADDYARSGLEGDYSKVNGLYYYAVYGVYSEFQDYRRWIGFVPNVVNITYNPFIAGDELDLTLSEYNSTRYGVINADVPDQWNPVLRINSQYNLHKTLSIQNLPMRTTTVTMDDEPILTSFPYTYYVLNDGFGNSKLIKPQFLPIDEGVSCYRLDVRVKTNINMASKYLMYVYGYKQDYNGMSEGFINKSPITLPNKSSFYSQFWATSSASLLANKDINEASNDLNYSQSRTNNLINGVSGVLGNALSFNLPGAIGSATNAITNMVHGAEQYDFNEFATEKQYNATIQDAISSPSTVKCTGSDMSFDKLVCNNSLSLMKYELPAHAKEKMKMYFKRYGYPYNNYTSNPCLRTRKCWNFIKFGNCNVYSLKIPHQHLQEIKAIFEKGITLWHMDRPNTVFKDYSTDNSEVK